MSKKESRTKKYINQKDGAIKIYHPHSQLTTNQKKEILQNIFIDPIIADFRALFKLAIRVK